MNGFKFLNKRSSDFGLRIEEGISFDSPELDFDFHEIKGRDGDVVLYNNRLKSVNKSLPVVFFPQKNKSLDEQITEVSSWLKGHVGYSELEIDSDNNYIYLAMYHEQYSIEKFLKHYGRAVLNFKIMPVKFLKSSMNETTLGSSINNPTSRTAKPKLIIKGSGNITVKIGSSELTLKNVDGGVIVDSQAQTITDLTGKRSQFNKMTSYPFIQIKPGHNTVLKTGTITSVSIVPRFEVIAT